MSKFHSRVQSQQVIDLNLPVNLACVFVKKQVVSIEPWPLPVLEPDGVLVKVIVTGICGSDLHTYTAGGVGGRPVTQRGVMGHESAGEVVAVGELVTSHSVGDRVAVEPGLPCRKCINCKSGRSNICVSMHYCGAPGDDGSMQRYFALPADMAPHISEGIPWEVAGSIQPLAIGVQIGKRADLRAHQTVAIFGCGPIGLISAAVAHAYSARKIIAFDISPSRVNFAKKYLSPITGKPIIDHVFHVGSLSEGVLNGSYGSNGHDDHQSPGDAKWEQAKVTTEKFLQLTSLANEGGVDRVIEASGSEDAGLNGVAIAKQGAIYLAVGLSHIQTRVFPTLAVTNKELDVRGITRYTPSCFPSAIDLLARGVVDLSQLITKTFPLSRAGEAFEAVKSGQEMKVIVMNQED